MWFLILGQVCQELFMLIKLIHIRIQLKNHILNYNIKFVIKTLKRTLVSYIACNDLNDQC